MEINCKNDTGKITIGFKLPGIKSQKFRGWVSWVFGVDGTNNQICLVFNSKK